MSFEYLLGYIPFLIGHILQYAPSSKRNLSPKILFKWLRLISGSYFLFYSKRRNTAIRSLKAERPMWNREMEGKAHCEDKTAATSRL